MQNNVCYNCYNYIPAGSVVCPFCGYNAADDAGRFPLALPPGTSLGGRYVVGRVLGQGGFGITYMALDCVTRQRAAIKEYFPESMAARTVFPIVTPNSRDREENFAYGKSCFLEEAKTLAEFIGDPNIVMVQGCFEENGTAYFVMDYVEGESLQDYARRRGGTVDWQTAKSIMYPVMRALAVVHSKGIVHRDVAPDNIFITTDGSIKLLDFGAARYSLGDRSRSLDVVLKHGFAPKEQYARHGRQGPFTDVYAVAASMYFIITGRVPPDSIDRMEHDELIPPSVLGADIPPADEHALLTALAVQTADRYKTMNEFLTALYPAYAQRQNYPPSQSVEQSYPQNQPIRQNYPPSQPIAQSYPQSQPIRQSYTPSQPIEQSYPQSQPIRQSYTPSQPIEQSYPQNQPIAQSYPPSQPIRQSYTPSQPEEDDTEQTMPPEHFAIPKAENQQPVYGTSGMYGSETPAPAPQTPQPQTVSRQQKASENPRLKRKAAAAAAAVVLLAVGGIIAVKAFGNRDSGESAEKTTTVMTPAPVTTSASFTDVSLPDSSEFNSSGDYSESDAESNIDPPVHHNGTADNIVIMYNGYQCSGSFTGTLYGGDVPDGEGVFTASYTDDDNDLHNITCTGRFVNGEMTGDFTVRDICGGEVSDYTGALVGGMMHGEGTIEVTFENGTDLVQKGVWDNGSLNGKGTAKIKYAGGGELDYEGNFENSNFCGNGTVAVSYTDGSKTVYNGEFKDNNKHGVGTIEITSASGLADTYEGEWADDKKEGTGKYKGNDENGDVVTYEGEWKDDSRNGNGYYRVDHSDGTSFTAEGIFKDSSLYTGKKIWYDKEGTITNAENYRDGEYVPDK